MTAIDKFAAVNGVRVHPRIFSDEVGGTAKFLETYGGRCPVLGDSRLCPCPESLTEIASPDPMSQHCTGWVIITGDYLSAIDPRGTLYGEATPPAPINGTDEVLKQYSLGVGEAISKFESGEFDDAFDVLAELADTSTCEVCQEELSVAAIHVNSARTMCELPYEGPCAAERLRVVDELERVRQMFSGKLAPPKKQKSDYRAKVTEYLNDPKLADAVESAKPEYRQKTKFSAAAKLAGGKAETIDDAIALVMEKNPGWF